MAQSESDYLFQLCTYAINVILTLIFVPLMGRWGWQFCRIETNLFNERYGNITKWEVIITIANMILTISSLGVYMHPIDSPSLQSLTMYLLNTSWNLTLFLLFTCWIYRFWLLRFEITFMHKTITKDWMLHIDPAIDNNREFLRNQSRFGGASWRYNWIIFAVINVIGFAYYSWSLSYFVEIVPYNSRIRGRICGETRAVLVALCPELGDCIAVLCRYGLVFYGLLGPRLNPRHPQCPQDGRDSVQVQLHLYFHAMGPEGSEKNENPIASRGSHRSPTK